MALRILFLTALLLSLSTFVFAYDSIALTGFCASCHGTNGSGPGETIPHIGGQGKEYLSLALNEMKDQKRPSTVMTTITKGYSSEELGDMAVWFSKRQWSNSPNKINEAMATEGQALSKPCENCHGKKGEGKSFYPRIAGQPVQYLNKAMNEFKNNQRNADGVASMMDIIKGMRDEDLMALAEYYSGLR